MIRYCNNCSDADYFCARLLHPTESYSYSCLYIDLRSTLASMFTAVTSVAMEMSATQSVAVIRQDHQSMQMARPTTRLHIDVYNGASQYVIELPAICAHFSDVKCLLFLTCVCARYSYRLDVCPSVRLSVTRCYCVETAQLFVKLSSLPAP